MDVAFRRHRKLFDIKVFRCSPGAFGWTVQRTFEREMTLKEPMSLVEGHSE